jgi:hypothetical protein
MDVKGTSIKMDTEGGCHATENEQTVKAEARNENKLDSLIIIGISEIKLDFPRMEFFLGMTNMIVKNCEGKIGGLAMF